MKYEGAFWEGRASCLKRKTRGFEKGSRMGKGTAEENFEEKGEQLAEILMEKMTPQILQRNASK